MNKSTCYRIRAGRITEMLIPADGLPLLTAKEPDGVAITGYAGEEDDDWSSYTLARVTEIATRLTPWATWYCCPDARDGDHIRPSDWGMSYGAQNTIWLRTSLHPDGAISGAFHEAYHSCEDWLTGDEIAVLRDASKNGPALPRSDNYNTYWCTDHEVRARAFAAWAYSHWLMGTTPTARIGDSAHTKLWTTTYNGGLGVRARRQIHHSRLPEGLRQKTSGPSAAQKVIMATWSVMAAAVEWVVDAFRSDAPPALRTK